MNYVGLSILVLVSDTSCRWTVQEPDVFLLVRNGNHEYFEWVCY